MSNLASSAASPAASAAESHSAPATEPAAAPVEAAASAAPVVDHAAETQPLDATPFVSVAAEQPAPAATEFFAPTTDSEVGDEVRERASAEPSAAARHESHDETPAEPHVGEAQPRQFGDAAASDAKFGGSSYHFSDDPHHGSQREVHDDGLELDQAPAQDAASDYSSNATVSEGLNGEAEPQPEPVTANAADFSPVDSAEISPEVLPSPADVPVNGSGALSGMLPAEPLFGSEQREEIADDYSPRDEEPSQADTREQEVYAEETHPGQLPQPAPSEEYWDREAAAREAEVLAQSSASLFAISEPEPPAMQAFERIPTLPPPNREALSEIPFLMPPVLPPQNSEQPSARSSDSEAVDDMVRKVMEKLGPHLQELLSQGVKPLVENLLQNELQKKDR